MGRHRIVGIGAAGQMTGVAVERLAARRPDVGFELYDLDLGRLGELAARLPRDRVRIGALDLFDDRALLRAIEGASLVVLGAGPYHRTAAPVMRACIAAGAPYIDLGDDVESTQHALDLVDEARAAGIAVLVGCGASPGMTNVMAVDAASRLDEVEGIDVCWVSGDEGPSVYGAAVIEHILHIGAGDCVTWRGGRRVTVESFRDSDVFPMGGGIGDYRLYEVAHPEALTLPRRYPGARSIRVMGGAHPQPVNGLIRGISRAVADGRITSEEAIKWFQEVMQDRNGSLRGWRHAFSGMVGQVRRRESSPGALARYLWMGIRKRHLPYRGGLLVRVTGIRDGAPASVIVRTPSGGPESYLGSSMATYTGTCLAAFITLALDDAVGRRGVLMPEDWVEPAAFYAALERLGVPRDEIVERPYVVT